MTVKLNLKCSICNKEIDLEDGVVYKRIPYHTDCLLERARKEFLEKLNNKELLEKLSDLEHQQWAHWTKYFLSMNTKKNNERWRVQMGTNYNNLIERDKEKDRIWARKVLEELKKELEKK